MTAEKFIFAWIKSEVLLPKKLMFKPTNLYNEMLKDIENNKNIENKNKNKHKVKRTRKKKKEKRENRKGGNK